MADDPKTAPQIDSQKIVKEISWVGARLREPSTYAGLALVLGAVFHVGDAQDWAANLQSIGMGVGGIVAVMLPEGKTTVKVAALLALCILGASLLAPMPAHAANKDFQFRKLKPSSLPAQKTAPATPVAASQQMVDPLTFLRQFSYNDVNNALQDANSQNPPNQTAAQCWAFLLTLLPAPAAAPTVAPTTKTPPATPAATLPTPASLLPAVPGVASAIQKALDDEQLLLMWLSPNGGLAQLNLACAPLVNMLNAKLLVGGAGTAAIAAAVTNPATAPLIAGVGTLLTGVIALVPK
jgi:hypothetical protein